MLDALKNFINELTGDDPPAKGFEAADYQLAAAALLVHIASIDGDFDADERIRIQHLVEARFGLSSDAARRLQQCCGATRGSGAGAGARRARISRSYWGCGRFSRSRSSC